MRRLPNLLLALMGALSFALADQVQASITINVNPANGYVDELGNVFTDPPFGLLAGKQIFGGPDNAAVLSFELPTIPVGETIVSASLSFDSRRYGPQSGAPFGDLYALGLRASPTVLSTDYFIGALDGSNTLLQDAILTPSDSTSVASYQTDASGDAALLAFLLSEYASGPAAGQYAMLRFNPDRTQAGDPRGYVLGSVASNRPAVLTIVTSAVPEPNACLLLLPVAASMALGWRRRVA